VLARLLRLWVVVTVAWVSYHLYLYRDRLSTFKDRQWGEALDYGVNSILCDWKIARLCHEVSVSLFRRSEANETFGFIVTFVGWPIVFFVACLIIAWIVHGPRRSVSQRSR
jgi:hypothetical protein